MHRFLSAEKRDGHEQLIHYGNTTGARIVCDICGRGFLQVVYMQLYNISHSAIIYHLLFVIDHY